MTISHDLKDREREMLQRCGRHLKHNGFTFSETRIHLVISLLLPSIEGVGREGAFKPASSQCGQFVVFPWFLLFHKPGHFPSWLQCPTTLSAVRTWKWRRTLSLTSLTSLFLTQWMVQQRWPLR